MLPPAKDTLRCRVDVPDLCRQFRSHRHRVVCWQCMLCTQLSWYSLSVFCYPLQVQLVERGWWLPYYNFEWGIVCCLVCYLPSHIQRALMEYLLTIYTQPCVFFMTCEVAFSYFAVAYYPSVIKRIHKIRGATSQTAHTAGAYPGFRSIKRLGIFLLPLNGMLVQKVNVKEKYESSSVEFFSFKRIHTTTKWKKLQKNFHIFPWRWPFSLAVL